METRKGDVAERASVAATERAGVCGRRVEAERSLLTVYSISFAAPRPFYEILLFYLSFLN